MGVLNIHHAKFEPIQVQIDVTWEPNSNRPWVVHTPNAPSNPFNEAPLERYIVRYGRGLQDRGETVLRKVVFDELWKINDCVLGTRTPEATFADLCIRPAPPRVAESPTSAPAGNVTNATNDTALKQAGTKE